jgi:tetratricopeptide (TPR) repeat protein
VGTDDNESERPTRPEEEPLPENVVRALAEARAAAAGAGTRRSGVPGTKSARWLAAIPLSAAVLTMLLLMPRATPPDAIPLPQIDGKALEAVRKDDIARAASARGTRLSGEVLAVGSALRELNRAQVSNASADEIGLAHTVLEHAFELVAANRATAADSLRTLRAVQTEGFLEEAQRFETTGKSTEELELLSGPFLDHMALAGWVDHGKIALDEAARRAAYKLVWNTLVGADRLPELKLTLDEQRALYTFYLTHPHAAEAQRLAYANMRRLSATEAECHKAIAQEKVDMEQWRIEKIRRLGEIDPTYPTGYALGVAYYREARYDLAVDAFRQWIEKHPDGALSLRARNHLMASVAAFGPT